MYGGDILSRKQAFEWHRRFREGRECVEDDGYSRRPHTSRTTENIENISAAVRKNRLQTIAESIGISSATCQRIPTKDLNMHRECQNIVPCMINEDQSAHEVKIVSQDEWKKWSPKIFTSVGISLLLFKGLISKENVFQQFN
ncbi:uncharacterized protein TNCV_1456851 [Trichonephila clavipes]|nr:uncharacterized protein TNCV_1456851 [Trichonephila clavipes]